MKKYIFILLLTLILIPNISLAQSNCPYDKVNDPYPGKCGQYVDTNNDQLCDHSQLALGEKNEKTILPKSTTTSKTKKIYHLLPIALFLIIFYIISHILSKKRIISIAKHRKIWNILLLISFLCSGILGIFLVIRINFGIMIPLPFNMLFWHVEMGIAMAIISIFHIMWHWAYFKTMFKK